MVHMHHKFSEAWIDRSHKIDDESSVKRGWPNLGVMRKDPSWMIEYKLMSLYIFKILNWFMGGLIFLLKKNLNLKNIASKKHITNLLWSN